MILSENFSDHAQFNAKSPDVPGGGYIERECGDVSRCGLHFVPQPGNRPLLALCQLPDGQRKNPGAKSAD